MLKAACSKLDFVEFSFFPDKKCQYGAAFKY